MSFKKTKTRNRHRQRHFQKNTDTLQTQTSVIHKIADLSQTQTDCRQPCLFNSDFNGLLDSDHKENGCKICQLSDSAPNKLHDSASLILYGKGAMVYHIPVAEVLADSV